MIAQSSVQATPGQIYTNQEIDALFGVTGEGRIRCSKDHQHLVLISDSASSINQDQWGQGYLRFAGMEVLPNERPENTLNRYLEESPENQMELDVFSKISGDRYTFLGTAVRCDFADGSRHQWAHLKSSDASDPNSIVYLLQTQIWPSAARMDAAGTASDPVIVSSWQSIPASAVTPPEDQQNWNHHADDSVEEALQNAIRDSYSEFWLSTGSEENLLVDEAYAPEKDIHWQLVRGVEPDSEEHVHEKFVDADIARMEISILAADHILKVIDPDVPESLLQAARAKQQQEPEPIDSEWLIWKH